jgi:hypothetical protein
MLFPLENFRGSAANKSCRVIFLEIENQVIPNYSFTVLIIDEDGFAIDIAWQEDTVESGQTMDLSISWLPQDAGNYTVKMFVWDRIENPSPLSDVAVSSISVL